MHDIYHGFRPLRSIVTSMVLATCCVFAYAFMEWLFFATKPSFLSPLTFFESLTVLLAANAVLLGFALPVNFVLIVVGATVRFFRESRFGVAVARYLFVLVPAFAITATIILLTDNFTYTLFRFNVGETSGLLRVLYATGYAIVLAETCRRLARVDAFHTNGSLMRATHGVAAGVLVGSVLALGFELLGPTDSRAGERNVSGLRTPNILILSSDGLNAQNMSVYGYHRPTTPFMESVKDKALLFENAFTNAGPTTGSIASLLSGKSSLTTRVLYRPDMFRGVHQTEHFVGLLREFGYTTADVSVPWFAGARSLNMRNAFDLVTSDFEKREFLPHERALYDLSERLPTTLTGEKYFLELTANRLLGRLYHATGVRDLSNPMSEVTNRDSQRFSDDDRLRVVTKFVAEARAPWFLNVHLMDTHGPKFRVGVQEFSKGASQDANWMMDFYDDAILEFDQRARQILHRLWAIDSNVVVIITSDHGRRWTRKERVPLLIFFPNGDHARKVRGNVQRLDVAPTLLDYLGIEIPDWIEGRSMLVEDPDPSRKILSTMVGKTHNLKGWRVRDYRQPYFSLGHIEIIQCQYLFSLAVGKELPATPESLKRQRVPGHTAPCDDVVIASKAEMLQTMNDALMENGYPSQTVTPSTDRD